MLHFGFELKILDRLAHRFSGVLPGRHLVVDGIIRLSLCQRLHSASKTQSLISRKHRRAALRPLHLLYGTGGTGMIFLDGTHSSLGW